jgi:hypothetical protein
MATFKAISRRQTPSSSYGKDDMITLLVGEDEEEMFAYGSYLSLYSGFFKAALKVEWAEGQTRTVKLPEEDPETVTFYLDFLYGKGLPTYSVKGESDNESHRILAELYALGEGRLDSKIQNATLKEILRLTKVGKRYYPDYPAIDIIYKSTTATSPTRRLLVEVYVSHGTATWIWTGMHPVFCQELAMALLTEVQSNTLPFRFRDLIVDDYLV